MYHNYEDDEDKSFRGGFRMNEFLSVGGGYNLQVCCVDNIMDMQLLKSPTTYVASRGSHT